MTDRLQEVSSDTTSRDRQDQQLADDALEAYSAKAARHVSGEPGPPGRVLVVDDESAMRSLLAAAVRGKGLECDLAANATDAIARIEQQVYDVIVVDIMLPDFNGLELIAAIRNRTPATRVIVITGYGDVKTATEALRAHADDYLLKPFKVSEFLASLERSLGRQKALRSIEMTQQQLTEQVAHLQVTLEKQSTGGIMALAKALEGRDPYTIGHTSRVAKMSLGLAHALGFQGKQLEELGAGALLHDVGKIAVPDSILLKKDRLTPEEYQKIQEHPRHGYDILFPFFGRGVVTECALYHHERWDGKGYPERLAGENCPPVGRILAICDAFDAMTSERPYRPALSESEALREIGANRGKQFDPQIADLFCEIRPDQPSRQEPSFSDRPTRPLSEGKSGETRNGETEQPKVSMAP